MSYNPRMSIVPAGQRSRKKEDEAEPFMRLPDKEIVGCITDIGIPFSVADLQKPNALQVQKIFEWFANMILNVTRETVDPAMRAAAEDVCGAADLGEALMPADTRNLLGFFAALRRLLQACGIADFSFADLHRPTHDRLVKVFSYLINFVRFRESHTGLFDEHYTRADTVKARVERLHAANRDMEAALAERRRGRKAAEQLAGEKHRRNEELKRRLLELRRAQERAAVRLQEAKDRKTELAGALEDRTAARLTLRQESAKLRPYVLQSAGALQSQLGELAAILAADKQHMDALDRRARALQTSADSFGVVATDVAGCVKVLDDMQTELAKEEEENVRKARQRDALTERGANVREVERTESLLQRQLAKWAERTEALRESAEEKAGRAKERMEEMRMVHRQLAEERSEKSKDVERRRVRMEQTEKKVCAHDAFRVVMAVRGAD